jgi:hypothetical protein
MRRVAPGNPGKKAMTAAEILADELAEVRRLIGPPPVQPVYRDAFTSGGTVGRIDNPSYVEQPAIVTDPNNALLAADYQAQLAAYQAAFAAALARLRELKEQQRTTPYWLRSQP